MTPAAGPRLSRRLANLGFLAFAWAATALALIALAAILWSLVSQGIGGIDLKVFTHSTPAPGSEGGLLNAILGSIMMCTLGLLVAMVVGILAGTWLSEYARGGAYGSVVRFINDILLSAPSILVGLFVYYILVKPFGGFSGYAGAVALAMLAAPVITRTTEDVLRLQPASLREASIALGAPVWHTVLRVIWKAAQAGMLTGVLLAFARISGETAPLLFTSLGNQYLNLDLSQPMAALPTTIFQFALSAFDDWRQLAWTGALLIAGAVLIINIVGRLLAREVVHK
jgi:phosphate transport system permease protein